MIQEKTQQITVMPLSEKMDIAQGLSQNNQLFRTFWDCSEIRYNPSVKKISISWSETDMKIHLDINKEYWDSCNEYDKQFLLVHEMMHVCLNHQSRFYTKEKLEGKTKEQKKQLAQATDIAINEWLAKHYISKNLLSEDLQKNEHWVENTFNGDTSIKEAESADYYLEKIYKMMEEQKKKEEKGKSEEKDEKKKGQKGSGKGSGAGGKGEKSDEEGEESEKGEKKEDKDGKDKGEKKDSKGDGKEESEEKDDSEGSGEGEDKGSHNENEGLESFNGSTIADIELQDIMKSGSPDIKENKKEEGAKATLEAPEKPENSQDEKELMKHIQHGPGGPSKAGLFEYKKTPKKIWESFIKKWVFDNPGIEEVEEESWANKHRRLSAIDVLLPGIREEEKFTEKGKMEAWVMLDFSGSVQHISDRIVKVCATIPEDKFKVRLFAFASQCKEVTVIKEQGKTPKLIIPHVGGGNDFRTNIRLVNDLVAKEKKEPKVLFVISDGEINSDWGGWGGSNAMKKTDLPFPERWHFIQTGHLTQGDKFIQQCHTHKFEDIENDTKRK